MDRPERGLRMERALTLPAEAASARAARQLLRDLLVEAGREQWIDSAVLAVSEIVTNVVLHAHTSMELMATISGAALLVEVRDGNPSRPQQRAYGTQATTGRGMDLVASVTSSHGLRALGPAGKVVWFRIDASARDDDDQERESWARSAESAGPQPGAEPARAGTTVLLLDLPPSLWMAARQQQDALLRELALYRSEHPGRTGQADLARADAARQLVGRTLGDAVDHARVPPPPPLPGGPVALEAAPAALDLELVVAPGNAEDFAHLQDALDEAEQLSRDGLLLAQPGLPEIVALRDWACEQVISQVGGAPATAWTDSPLSRATGPERNDLGRRALDGESSVTASGLMQVAADQSNRIIAVSRPLADWLGWDPDDLVGRRLVVLIPHRLREAHVAGFTRHVSTGRDRLIDVPIELPFLHADLSESTATLVIATRRTTSGHLVYVTTVGPSVP